MIELGSKVRCKITGLEGIAVIRSEFLNGCIQYEVQPPSDKKHHFIPDSIGIDEHQLTVLMKPTAQKKKKTAKKRATGGPMRASIKMRGF